MVALRLEQFGDVFGWSIEQFLEGFPLGLETRRAILEFSKQTVQIVDQSACFTSYLGRKLMGRSESPDFIHALGQAPEGLANGASEERDGDEQNGQEGENRK